MRQQGLTSLIISKLDVFFDIGFVGVRLSVEAIIFFKRDSQPARACVYATPICNKLSRINFRYHVFQMPRAK